MDVTAEITANVWQVRTEVGATVSEGDELVILESMKMEIPVEAPISGTVTSIAVKPDDQVTVEQLIDSMVIYGSPKTVTEKLLAFRERTGPFGGLLMAMMDGSGANRAREFESMTLLAREVMPAVRSALAR